MPADAPESPAAPALTLRRVVLQLVGFAVGVALIVWCVRTAAADGAWERIRGADPLLLAGLLASSVASLVINAAMFWTALLPVRRHSIWRLTLLNGVAGLLNYAPVRLGLVARIAYHLRVDRMGAGLVASWMLVVAALMFFALGVVGVAMIATGRPGLTFVLLVAAQLVLGRILLRAALPMPPVAAAVRRLDGLEPMLRRSEGWWGSIAMRLADIAAFTLRMSFAARILGLELTAQEIVLLGVVAQLVSLSPVGRLGFREAAVAFVAARMEQGLGSTDVDAVFAQLALVESAGEAVVLVATGLVAAPWYAMAMRKRRGAGEGNQDSGTGNQEPGTRNQASGR